MLQELHGKSHFTRSKSTIQDVRPFFASSCFCWRYDFSSVRRRATENQVQDRFVPPTVWPLRQPPLLPISLLDPLASLLGFRVFGVYRHHRLVFFHCQVALFELVIHLARSEVRLLQ